MGFKRLLKDATVGMYYAADGSWTPEATQARDFPDAVSAVQTAMKLGRSNLYLVLKFADSRMDVSHRLDFTKLMGGQHTGEKLLLAVLPAASAAAPMLQRLSQ